MCHLNGPSIRRFPAALPWTGAGLPFRRPRLGRGPEDASLSALQRVPLEYSPGSRHTGVFPGVSRQQPACQCRRNRRRGFRPWVGKIPLKKEMATHSSTLAWRIPWTEEPGGLQSMGSHRVGLSDGSHTHTQAYGTVLHGTDHPRHTKKGLSAIPDWAKVSSLPSGLGDPFGSIRRS